MPANLALARSLLNSWVCFFMVKNLRPGRVRWGTAPLCLLLPARPESIEHAHPHAALPEYGEAGVPQSSHPSEARLDGGLRAVGSFAWQGVGRAPRFAEPSPYHFFVCGNSICGSKLRGVFFSESLSSPRREAIANQDCGPSASSRSQFYSEFVWLSYSSESPRVGLQQVQRLEFLWFWCLLCTSRCGCLPDLVWHYGADSVGLEFAFDLWLALL